MKHETVPKPSNVAQSLTNGVQPVATGEAAVNGAATGADAGKQEVSIDPVLAETAEHRYYPMELSDEELMNLDFAGC